MCAYPARLVSIEMDKSLDVADPTDWIETRVSKLVAVESALRCQVCKDFFNTPMITSCCHTFCSLCIRRCLTEDGICPTCRSPDQMMKLRQNWSVQEVVESFQIARPEILQLGKDLDAQNSVMSKAKRKREVEDSEAEDEAFEEVNARRRKTRSQHREASTQSLGDSDGMNDDDGDGDDGEYQPNDGLSACPICQKRMKPEKVFAHLDVHNGTAAKSPTLATPANSRYFGRSNQSDSVQPMERLPQINYSLLRDTQLRKKLTELGIPNHGPKALLMKRHTEWVNLVNANCDSRRPKSKRDLLRELDVWDKTQGRHLTDSAGPNTSAVMHKDFDGAAWATNHDTDFKRLIANAKLKRRSEQPSSNGGESTDLIHNGNSTSDVDGSRAIASLPVANGGALQIGKATELPINTDITSSNFVDLADDAG